MLYEYKCKCGHIEDKHNPVDERHTNAPMHCGERMGIRISGGHHIAPVLGGGGFPGYKCPITDKFVTSRKERKEIMAKRGVVETG